MTDPIASYNIRITLFAFLGREERNAARIRYAEADYIVRHRPRDKDLTPANALPILNGSDAEEGWFWREMIGVVSSLDLRNGGDIANTIAI